MKKIIPAIIFALTLFISFSCNSRDVLVAPSFTPADKAVASSSGDFGMNLLNNINKTEADSNIVISPLSISTALGMTLNGANGRTYTQMKNTLQLSGNTQTAVNQSFLNLNSTLNTADPNVCFTTANSIWCRQDLNFNQSFLDVNKKYFSARIQNLDFTNPASVGIINDWVSDNTKGKITKIIDRIPPEMVMYLINAIYFKADWTNKFDSMQTTLKDFYLLNGGRVLCSMMYQRNNYDYYKAGNYQAVKIPYGNGNFNMLILLPNDSIDVNLVLRNVNESMLAKINSGLTKQDLKLYLPRFQANYDINLNNPLIELGMPDAFDRSLADLSKISDKMKLFISEVIHKTFIKVGEQGTEAAAVTEVGVGITAVIENSAKVFYVDHPFIFLITEKNSGAILFAGKIVNPLN